MNAAAEHQLAERYTHKHITVCPVIWHHKLQSPPQSQKDRERQTFWINSGHRGSHDKAAKDTVQAHKFLYALVTLKKKTSLWIVAAKYIGIYSVMKGMFLLEGKKMVLTSPGHPSVFKILSTKTGTGKIRGKSDTLASSWSRCWSSATSEVNLFFCSSRSLTSDDELVVRNQRQRYSDLNTHDVLFQFSSPKYNQSSDR